MGRFERVLWVVLASSAIGCGNAASSPDATVTPDAGISPDAQSGARIHFTWTVIEHGAPVSCDDYEVEILLQHTNGCSTQCDYRYGFPCRNGAGSTDVLPLGTYVFDDSRITGFFATSLDSGLELDSTGINFVSETLVDLTTNSTVEAPLVLEILDEPMPALQTIFDDAARVFAATGGLPVASRGDGTPSPGTCCATAGLQCFPDPTVWTEPWATLGFSIGTASRFSFTFLPQGTGDSTTFTVRAQSDLDCDNTYSTFELYGKVDPTTHQIVPAGSFINLPDE